MSAPADQMPSSFDARTQMSTSSSNRTASLVRLRSFMRSASYVLAFGLFIHATATRSFFSSEMYVRSIAFASVRCKESGHNKRWPLPARSRLRRAPLLVEQELLFDELPVPAPHIPIGQDRPEVVDVGAAFDRLPAVRQQISVDIVREVHVAYAGGLGPGHSIVAVFREPTDSEEPAIREEHQVVRADPFDGLPRFEDSAEDRLRFFAGAAGLRLDDRQVDVLDFAEDLVDVDPLRLGVLQRLEDALDEVPAEFRAEHLQAARLPHVQGVLEVLDLDIPAVGDGRHRDRLHEGLSRREVVRFLQEPHPWHRDGHGAVEEVLL